KIGPDPRNFNQRVSLGRNDLLIRTFPKQTLTAENSDIRCKYMSIYLKTLKLLRVTLHKSVNKLAQIV
ncbi:hypothetical protein QP288_18495, partial [Escherichia coli]|nr:hypothetical protein [Escherichia coli]